MRLFVLLLLTGSLCATAVAQAPPSAPELVRGWLVSQRSAGAGLERVSFDERMRWTVDGPFGAREIALEARVSGTPGGQDWDRDVLAMGVDGRPLPRPRWGQMADQMQRLLGPSARLIASGSPPIARLLTVARPVGNVVSDRAGAEPTWRVEVVPREPTPAIDRVTLWFSQADGRLVRSRSVLTPRQGALVSTVVYNRYEGIDLPAERRVEGTLQTRRRGRSFTMLFDLTARYDDFHLQFGDR